MSVRQVEAAAGTKGSPGVVLLLATPRGSSASASRIAGVTHRLRRVGGIARTEGPAAVSRDARRVLVTGTLHAGADDATTARSVQSAFRAAVDPDDRPVRPGAGRRPAPLGVDGPDDRAQRVHQRGAVRQRPGARPQGDPQPAALPAGDRGR